MTNRERVVISAYTGVLMYKFEDLHEYIETLLERPVWTHELADKDVWNQVKEKSKPDFLALCSND